MNKLLANGRALRLGSACLVVCAVVVVIVVMPARAQQPSVANATLDNAAVVKLVRARFSEKTIIQIIRARPARFDLTPDRLIELKRNGVTERIILTMLARDDDNLIARASVIDSDDEAGGGSIADDPFFNNGANQRSNSPGVGKSPDKTDPGEVNIFGSSGGARGRVSSRGGNGSASGDTQTNGSATVRILRPATEAGGNGGAAPKLERTPTLNNDAVIELVSAGFSEGTIIRRIEDSPAAFDFAPAKLAELRRRRVTEPVINAMRAAMSDDGDNKSAHGSSESVKPQR